MPNVLSSPIVRGWLMLLLFCNGALLVAEPTALETVEKSAGDWLKVRAETARLETEWTTQRPMLETMVHGLNERAQSLEGKRDLLKAKTAKDRDDQARAEGTNATIADSVKETEAQLRILTSKLVALRLRLPPRLSSALDLSYKSLDASDLTVGERTHLAVTVLNRCLQFNRSVMVEEEVLALNGAEGAKELEVIYWGLSNAYALDRHANKVWLGFPGDEGWKWEPLSGGAENVAKIISTYQGKSEPEFVQLPGRLAAQARK